MVAGSQNGQAVVLACALVSMLGIGTVTAPAVYVEDDPDGTRITGDGLDGTRITGTDGTRVT